MEIQKYQLVNGFSPTMRELSENAGKSLTATQSMIHAMKRNGWLTFEETKGRRIGMMVTR